MFHIGLVSESDLVTTDDVAQVSAAVQRQVLQDFAPEWDVSATVDTFAKLSSVPIGTWPIVIRDDIGVNGQGSHRDRLGRPFALVASSENWPLSVSHEALEMLADPFGARLKSASSVAESQGIVEYLVEVCDPCQHRNDGYDVNGIRLSNFATPDYYDPLSASTRYDFVGKLTQPLDVLVGGYLSWRVPQTGEWFQCRRSSQGLRIVSLGQHPPVDDLHLRGLVDRATRLKKYTKTKLTIGRRRAVSAQQYREAQEAQAAGWRRHIDRLIANDKG